MHQVPFTWNYFATGHGKGIVDGYGGEAKSVAYEQVLSKMGNVLLRMLQILQKFAQQIYIVLLLTFWLKSNYRNLKIWIFGVFLQKLGYTLSTCSCYEY